MFLKELFKKYLSEDSKLEVQDILKIPSTKVGIHALELDKEILLKEGSGFLKKVEKNIKTLKSVSLHEEEFYQANEGPQNLYDLVKKWNEVAMSNTPDKKSEFDEIMLECLNELKPAYYYSVLYESVLKGETRKRGVRLHFSDTTLPFVTIHQGKITQFELELSSVSLQGLLLKINPAEKEIIEKAASFSMIINPKIFFNSWFSISDNPEDEDENPERKELEKWKKVDTMKFSIDKKKISFANNQLEMASETPSQDTFLCLNFSALHDTLLLSREDWERLFEQEIENLRKYINQLISED